MKTLWAHRYFILGGIVFLLLVTLLWLGGGTSPSSEEEVAIETSSNKDPGKSTPTLSFGNWAPSKNREILATVESDQETVIVSEVSGTVDRVFVEIGDRVQLGQLLATFQKQDDQTQINFENANQNLTTVRLSADNSVRSAEVALEVAEAEREQTEASQDQNYEQTFQTLQTMARKSETTLWNAFNFVDRIIGGSSRFRYETFIGRNEIGAKNYIKKNKAKNLAESLRRELESLFEISRSKPTEADIFEYSKDRLQLAKGVQELLFIFNDLIRDTILSENFSEADRAGIQTSTETYLATIDAEVLSLETQIESARTFKQTQRTALLAAENRVRNAEANLDLARANASSQVSSAQNALRLASSSRNDLEIRAPFAGKILSKDIRGVNRVMPNQKLFVLSNELAPKKIVSFLTLNEWEIFQKLDTISVEIGGEILETDQKFLSSQLDPTTQKIRVEIEINSDVLIGSFATILLPLQPNGTPLVPISAVSFEPDGAEVMVLNPENITERRKVSYGKIISDAVEVQDGLKDGDQVIQFYNRVGVGDLISQP